MSLTCIEGPDCRRYNKNVKTSTLLDKRHIGFPPKCRTHAYKAKKWKMRIMERIIRVNHGDLVSYAEAEKKKNNVSPFSNSQIFGLGSGLLCGF